MNYSNSITVAVVSCLLLILNSCNQDPVSAVEKSIEAYNFTEALRILSELERDGKDGKEIWLLLAKAQLASGDLANGFESILKADISAGESAKIRSEYSRVLFHAAEIILREKSRVEEALVILDSTIAWDKEMKNKVQKVVWDRGIEYMSVAGDAGYKLLKYSINNDPKVLGRLHGFNRKIANRYENIDGVFIRLAKLNDSLQSFRNSYNRDPQDLQEVINLSSINLNDLLTPGWAFGIRNDNNRCEIIAEVTSQKATNGVPAGTILSLK